MSGVPGNKFGSKLLNRQLTHVLLFNLTMFKKIKSLYFLFNNVDCYISGLSIGYGSLKHSRRNSKRRQHYEISNVKSETDLKKSQHKQNKFQKQNQD